MDSDIRINFVPGITTLRPRHFCFTDIGVQDAQHPEDRKTRVVSFPGISPRLSMCTRSYPLTSNTPARDRGDSSKNCMFHIILTEYPKLPPYPPGESTAEAKIPWIHHLFGMTRRGYLGEHITIFGGGGQKPMPQIRLEKSHRPGSHIAALVRKSLVLRTHLGSAYQGTK